MNQEIDKLTGIEKEKYIDNSMYDQDDHIDKVIKKILRPDNAYTKFDFKNGKPTKSAILTTSSIAMAKRYYHAIKAMTKDKDWMEQVFPNRPIREGRTMDDPDFPRTAITYLWMKIQRMRWSSSKKCKTSSRTTIDIIKPHGRLQTSNDITEILITVWRGNGLSSNK